MKFLDDEMDRQVERMRQHMENTLKALSRRKPATLFSDSGWRPSTDLYETTDEFVVLVALAGMKPQNVEVVVDHNTLRIAGTRCRPLTENVTRIHQMEIDFGPFALAIRLPKPVDVEGVTSTYRDGFLTVCLPKPAKASGTISVTVAE